MKPIKRRLIFVATLLLFVVPLVVLIATAPNHPIALIRVVDVAGKPIAGAVIKADGLRPKSGPYAGGHYGWRSDPSGVPNDPVITDDDGYANVPYPKYVFERIETGEISFSVNHADFVPDRPFRVITTVPPAGAPWRVWGNYLWNRIQRKALISKTNPVVLQRGSLLKLSLGSNSSVAKDAPLFAQVSGVWDRQRDFWIRPKPGMIVTRRLSAGPHTVRAVQFDSNGSAWFSEVIPITAKIGQTNDLIVNLRRGVTVRGQLDGTVPRPVKNARVVANVLPQGSNPKDSPPRWHAWATAHEDGSFAIASLPTGDLEIVALCEGFVSTNGPGQFRIRYPQKHLLGTNDIAVTIGMEPTARLEVLVTDENGKPLKDVRVVTWPNVRYGEWSATVLMSDCYNTSELLLLGPDRKLLWGQPVLDFQGVSDSAGLAVLPNLPASVTELAVEHPQFALPAVGTAGSEKRRQASFTLIANQTNRVSVQLEPRERSTITHY